MPRESPPNATVRATPATPESPLPNIHWPSVGWGSHRPASKPVLAFCIAPADPRIAGRFWVPKRWVCSSVLSGGKESGGGIWPEGSGRGGNDPSPSSWAPAVERALLFLCKCGTLWATESSMRMSLSRAREPTPRSSCQAEPRTTDTDQLAAGFITASKKTRQEKPWVMLERVKVSPFPRAPAGPGLDGCLGRLFWFPRLVAGSGWLGTRWPERPRGVCLWELPFYNRATDGFWAREINRGQK